jgi:hypothetical protein
MTLVKLQEGAIDSIVGRKITEVTNIYKENNTIDFSVAPFSRIHLHSYFGFGKSPGAILYVYIFGAIAIFVLLIACINFMNLSTARSSIRAKEIGLRKVNGASRMHLIKQYLTESFVQTLLSVLVAFLLVLLLLNQFNHISGKDIEASGLFSVQFLLGIFGVLVITTLLAGSYPALYLSALRPVRAIREQTDQRTGSGLLRKILVVFQFTLAVILITGAMVATRQLTYMRSADLGYNKFNLVHIPLRGNLNQEYLTLKQSFMEHPAVQNATASMQAPIASVPIPAGSTGRERTRIRTSWSPLPECITILSRPWVSIFGKVVILVRTIPPTCITTTPWPTGSSMPPWPISSGKKKSWV